MSDITSFTSAKETFGIHHILPADEQLLRSDIFLILLYANRIPPHLLLTVGGKIFTLGIKGATVDRELDPFLTLVRQKKAETIFFRLKMPPILTEEQLQSEIRKFMLAYPRVDIGVATCLNPIRDFCGKVYDPSAGKANFIFELLPKLRELGVMDTCYHLNMEPWLHDATYDLKKYTMNDIYEGIREAGI